MLKRLHYAGRPVPLVTLVFVEGRAAFTVQQIREASPSTVIIARDLRGLDYHAEDKGGWDRATRADGRAYFDANAAGLTADMRRANYIQIRDLNEPGEGTKINDWMHGMIDGANALGVKVCVYNFSVGNPGLPGDKLRDGSPRPYRDFWTWSSTHELLRRVKREGHAFCLHQYTNDKWTDDYTILRHRRIYKLLPADLQDLKVWFNEYGESYKFPGTRPDRDAERYRGNLRTTQQAMKDSPGDGDVALWTIGLGSDEWIPDRIDHVLGVAEQVALEG
jgi:hypothetical protein